MKGNSHVTISKDGEKHLTKSILDLETNSLTGYRREHFQPDKRHLPKPENKHHT